MTWPSTDPAILVIQANACFQIDNFGVEVRAYLGLFADAHYFNVNIHNQNADISDTLDEVASGKPGLLRVGTVEGGLNQELQLRQVLGNHKMVSELLNSTTEDWISVNCFSEQAREDDFVDSSNDESNSNDCAPLPPAAIASSEYLEEEFLEPQRSSSQLPSRKIILLSYLPDEEKTLAARLQQDHSLETSLSLASQVCQFFRYVYQHGWCFIQIIPTLIQVGTPIQFFDLSGIRVVGEKLSYGLTGIYCPPELASGCPIEEKMSTYVVGTLLYQSIHHQLPDLDDPIKLEIKPIPRIYQILSACLAPLSDRFSLSQLLSLLVETRQVYGTSKVQWSVASRSTVGLSLSRMQNEDSYGVKQQSANNQSETLILGVVADGMGGMAQGEVASRLAVKTVLEEPLPIGLKSPEDRAKWLKSLVQKANDCVAKNVKEAGTTLSLIFAVERDLAIAHVGDSRIFLLRNGYICQLSEDHSMVAMLLASGQIAYEESQNHPDRSVLTKSIGSKRQLSDGYIQDLTRWGAGLSMSLENRDTLLICSDGVWDLVTPDELAEIFVNSHTLQAAVNQTIEQVLNRGANDNATILALQCSLDKYYE